MFCETDNILLNISMCQFECREHSQIFHEILPVPHNIGMDLNNVYETTSMVTIHWMSRLTWFTFHWEIRCTLQMCPTFNFRTLLKNWKNCEQINRANLEKEYEMKYHLIMENARKRLIDFYENQEEVKKKERLAGAAVIRSQIAVSSSALRSLCYFLGEYMIYKLGFKCIWMYA